MKAGSVGDRMSERQKLLLEGAALLALSFVFYAGSAPKAGGELEYAMPSAVAGYFATLGPSSAIAGVRADTTLKVELWRPDVRSLADMWIGVLIWLTPLCAVGIGGFHQKLWKHPFGLTPALVLLGMVAAGCPDILAALLMAGGIAWAVIVARRVRGNEPLRRPLVLILFSIFALAAGASSMASHILCTRYRGLAPVLAMDEQHLPSLYSAGLGAPAPRQEDILDDIARLPGLNTWSYPTNIFFRAQQTTTVCLIAGLVYLCAFVVCVAKNDVAAKSEEKEAPAQKDQEGNPTTDKDADTGENAKKTSEDPYSLLAWSLAFYLSVGAMFGLQFYVMYVSEAARQNTLLLYSRVLQLAAPDAAQLQRQFAQYGWSRRLENDLDTLRRVAALPNNLTAIRQATLAGYWGSAVVAQERPAVAATLGQTSFKLAPDATVFDLFYFSFASFTTTGYGDMRPISDAARMWAVVENVAELLFTALFFAVVLNRMQT